MKEETNQSTKAKGGYARAQKLTPEQRSEISRKAAVTRWSRMVQTFELPQVIHEGILKIAGKEIYCAVLPNGKRVLSQAQFLLAIGRSKTAKSGTGVFSDGDGLPAFLMAERLKPFVTEELRAATTPLFFLTLDGRRAVGYDAEILPMVCEAYLNLRDYYVNREKNSKQRTNHVPLSHRHIVAACDILMRSLAHVGIIALIDEATGYQYARARKALEEILEKFISKELRKWVKTFPDEFYEQIYRLKGWTFDDINKRPLVFSRITIDLVYERLAPGVLERLKSEIPKNAKGKLKQRLHQKLSEDFGHPRLKEHLASEITLMRIFDDGQWDSFYQAVNKALPKQTKLPLFDAELDYDDKKMLCV